MRMSRPSYGTSKSATVADSVVVAEVRRRVLRDGVSAASRALGVGREPVLYIAGGLPCRPADVALVTMRVRAALEMESASQDAKSRPLRKKGA